MLTRAALLLVIACAPAASADDAQSVRLLARPRVPGVALDPGEHRLGLGGQRDGTLYIPAAATSAARPLIVLLHGAGQGKEFFRFMLPLAEELGVVLLVPDSRERTWDGIRGRFGPDVRFIEAALAAAFDRVSVDPQRIAIGGFSDGASYALSVGLGNGDLFTHVVAFTPGSFRRPAELVGRPRIFLSHGTRDRVLDIDRTSRRVVPILEATGYDITYQEFDGPHQLPPPTARAALAWLAGEN
jgi:phospholipase/carboxylesterase